MSIATVCEFLEHRLKLLKSVSQRITSLRAMLIKVFVKRLRDWIFCQFFCYPSNIFWHQNVCMCVWGAVHPKMFACGSFSEHSMLTTRKCTQVLVNMWIHVCQWMFSHSRWKMANGLNLKEALFIGCLKPELNALISHDSDCLFS